MMLSAPVTIDLYGITEHGLAGHADTSGRTEVSAALDPEENTAVILVAGQSLATNAGETPYTPSSSKVQQINIYDGLVYELVDPVLGASSTSGSWISRLGDKLITAGTWERVIFIPIAIGSTSALQWSPDGNQHHRFNVGIKRARQHGYALTAILWDQGNRDANAGTSSQDYQDRVNALIAASRTWGPVSADTPWFIATETMKNDTDVSATIQAAQAAIVAADDNVFAGANTDSLTGATNRQSGISHLTDMGNDNNADLWKAVLDAHFSA